MSCRQPCCPPTRPWALKCLWSGRNDFVFILNEQAQIAPDDPQNGINLVLAPASITFAILEYFMDKLTRQHDLVKTQWGHRIRARP